MERLPLPKIAFAPDTERRVSLEVLGSLMGPDAERAWCLAHAVPTGHHLEVPAASHRCLDSCLEPSAVHHAPSLLHARAFHRPRKRCAVSSTSRWSGQDCTRHKHSPERGLALIATGLHLDVDRADWIHECGQPQNHPWKKNNNGTNTRKTCRQIINRNGLDQ